MPVIITKKMETNKKEMDYEKRYKEALEKIREGLQPLSDGAKISGVTKAFLEEVFPELKETEDERIKKELTKFLKNASGGFLDTTIQCKTFGKWAAWLEKQGEHDETSIAIKNPEAYRIGFADGEAHAKEEMNVWSEDDENVLEDIEEAIINYWHGDTQNILLDWLKSLKERLI